MFILEYISFPILITEPYSRTRVSAQTIEQVRDLPFRIFEKSRPQVFDFANQAYRKYAEDLRCIFTTPLKARGVPSATWPCRSLSHPFANWTGGGWVILPH